MKKNFFLSLIALFAALISVAEPPAEEGKTIFTSRCAGCHNVNKTLTGPALAGLHERRSMEWIVSFIQSSQSLIKNGDKDAVALFEKFNRIPMPDHKDLSTEDINNIVLYIKSASTPAEGQTAPFKKPTKPLHKNYTLLTMNDYGYFTAFFVSVALLITALLLLVKVKTAQRENSGEEI